MDWSTFTIGNSAGFVKGPGPEFDELLRAAVTDITIGSITMEARPGNPGNVYWRDRNGTSINSLGLPNPGRDVYERIEAMQAAARAADKRLRISIAPFSPHDAKMLALDFGRFGTIEVNLGCPNVWGKDRAQKPIPSFDLALMEETLDLVSGETKNRFDVKLSPYSDPAMIEKVALVLRRTNVGNVVTSNTFPNSLAFVGSKRAIDMPLGGMGGTALNYIALGQVAQFAAHLAETDIGIIGVGGIATGADVLAMREAGASGIQIGTAYEQFGAKIFSDVLQEAGDLIG